MNSSRLALCRWAVFAAVVVLLQGCGFQLRGDSSPPSDISPLWIEGIDQYGSFRDQLTNRLKSSGVEIASEESTARARLLIDDRRSNRRTLSLDGSGKVIEYQLYEAFRYSLHHADGRVLADDRRVSTTHDHVNTEDLILGRQQEEATIRTEMRRHLIDAMLRRLERR